MARHCIRHPELLASDLVFHITMCLRVLRDALVSQVEYFRLRRSRATASERAMVRANLVLWEPMHGRAQQGRPRQSYLSMLLKEVGTNSKEELRTLMRDRDIWRGLSGVDRT